MPSLMAILGLNGTSFKAGLDKAVKQASEGGDSISKNLAVKLEKLGVFKAIANPVMAAFDLAHKFIDKVIAKVDELKDRAKDIKIGAARTNLTQQQYQPIMYAAQAVGADPEAAGKGIVKLAEAQEKIKISAPGSEALLDHFSKLGISIAQLNSLGPQELFLKIADSMHVAQLSGEQMAAGGELLGKTFEALEPVFKRGFNDPVDKMKMLTDDEIQRLNTMSRNTAILKGVWEEAFQSIANASVQALGLGSKSILGGDDMDDNLKRLQERLNKQTAIKAKAANAERQKELNDTKDHDRLKSKRAELSKLEEANDMAGLSNQEKLVKLQEERLALQEALVKSKSEEGQVEAKIGIARIEAEMLKLNGGKLSQGGGKTGLDLTANQRIGAYSSVNASSLAEKTLDGQKLSNMHLAKIVSLLEKPDPPSSGGVQYQ